MAQRIIRPAIGKCVYCGATNDLTMEHVVPFALGGQIESPESSCRACAKITSQFERLVCRNMFGPLRTRFNAPTRRPKQRAALLPLKIRTKTGEDVIKMVPADQHPATFSLPELTPPRFLKGPMDLSAPIHEGVRPWIFSITGPFEEVAPEDSGFYAGVIEMDAFVRFLAKMAHCQVATIKGIDAFEPMLIPLILGKTRSYADLVGGELRAPISGEAMGLRTYEIVIRGHAYAGCEIDIYPHMNTPAYNVIVGKLKPAAAAS